MTLVKKHRNHTPRLSDVFFGNNWVDELFNTDMSTANHFRPQADVIEREKEFELRLALPGMSKKDLKIDLIDNKLTISGETAEDEKKEGESFLSREIVKGSFHREFKLGNQVDADKINATFADGLLTVLLAKSEKAQPKTILIK